MALVSSRHCGMAMSDADAVVACFGPLVLAAEDQDSRFLVRGPRWECPKSLWTQHAFYS